MKLSEFKGEKAIEVAAELLLPITKIVANPENAKRQGANKLEFASAMLKNSPSEVMEILAILNRKDGETFQCNGVTAMVGLFELLSDPEMMELFGLQSKTEGQSCSGAQSESTEAPKT